MIMRTLSCHALHGAVFLAMVAAPMGPGLAAPEAEFHYDGSNVDTAAHWAARSTLANAVMFSGLGEPLSLSMSEMDAILAHAGYVMRPPMPEMALVGAVYEAGDPRYPEPPDFDEPPTLCWDETGFDRKLDPAAQAWTLVKITSPGFHLTYHDRKADRRAALLMLPQAEAQARALAERLANEVGLFAPRATDSMFGPARTADQAAVLWGASNLVLAATSEAADYWHQAYRDLVDANDYRPLADTAFGAIKTLPPEQARDRATAIEALGRYALAAESAETRRGALDLARKHADELVKSAPPTTRTSGLRSTAWSRPAACLARQPTGRRLRGCSVSGCYLIGPRSMASSLKRQTPARSSTRRSAPAPSSPPSTRCAGMVLPKRRRRQPRSIRASSRRCSSTGGCSRRPPGRSSRRSTWRQSRQSTSRTRHSPRRPRQASRRCSPRR